MRADTTSLLCFHFIHRVKKAYETSNDNGIRVVNFATSKNLIVKITTLPHRDIHKHTWTSPDGVTHNQMDHVLIDKRRNLHIFRCPILYRS
jgi:hypothetical protein